MEKITTRTIFRMLHAEDYAILLKSGTYRKSDFDKKDPFYAANLTGIGPVVMWKVADAPICENPRFDGVKEINGIPYQYFKI